MNNNLIANLNLNINDRKTESQRADDKSYNVKMSCYVSFRESLVPPVEKSYDTTPFDGRSQSVITSEYTFGTI